MLDLTLASVVSLFMTGNTAQFRKFATERSEQGKGHGTALLLHMLSILPQHQVKTVWCNARKDKTAFYAKFGFMGPIPKVVFRSFFWFGRKVQ
jgi:N-acetylglutamate synthase-like GNAT family acetyltransferase